VFLIEKHVRSVGAAKVEFIGRRSRISTVFCAVIAVGTFAIVTSSAATHVGTPTATANLVVGKRLYRQFCGQCHALSQALSAGFGSDSGALKQLGGPSFNQLRVPYIYSVDAVSEPTGGHELVRRRITMAQLSEVAAYLAKVTARNPVPALPTDG
jgi:mono/diheme cytochrome c family protein